MKLTLDLLYEAVRALNSARGYHGRICLNALGTAVHFWHETGGLASRLMLENWNLAGIACTRSWVSRGGKCFSGKTWEHIKGRDVNLVRGFRSYPSLAAFLEDYSRLIKNYYPVSADNPDCVWGYLAGLRRGLNGRKWATDPLYVKKLFSLARRLGPEVLGAGSTEILKGSARAFHNRGLDQFLPAGTYPDAPGPEREQPSPAANGPSPQNP